MEHKQDAGRPQTYAEYCAALHGGDEEVRLMYAVRSWFFALQTKLELGTSELLVTGLCLPERICLEQDAFSGLLAGCQRALENILTQPHQKLLRENAMLPVHKVRELDSSGISWLERRPGRTMREKVRNSRSLLAVNRRSSLDTDENRLLKLFVRRCREIALCKLEGLDPAVDTMAEQRFLRVAAKLKAMPEMEEVREWNSPQPNLVLTTDLQYRQIWKAWIALNALDLQIRQDAQLLSEHIAVILWAELLVRLRGMFRLPQLPLRFDPQTCTLELSAGPGCLQGMDAVGDTLTLRRAPGQVWVEYRGQTVKISVLDRTALLQLRGKGISRDSSLRLTVENLLQPVSVLWEMLELPEAATAISAETADASEAALDLFAAQPLFFRDTDSTVRQLAEPLLGQELQTAQGTLRMACAGAKAVWLGAESTLFSVGSSVRDGRAEQLRVLASALKKQLPARTLTCLVPDSCSAFELNPLRTALHLIWPHLTELPESIAALFSALRSDVWRSTFRDGDYVLVVDLQGMQCSLTMLRGNRTGKNWDGPVWERHLRVLKPLPECCQQEIRTLYRRLEKRGLKDPDMLARMLGIDGLLALCKKMALWQEGDIWIRPCIEEIHLDVTSCVEEFLQEFTAKQTMQRQQVHLLLLSKWLRYTGSLPQNTENQIDLLQGYRQYASCHKKYNEPLWYDYLPRLAIQQMTGSFELVDPARARVEPGRRERMSIAVKGQFILPKGKADYHFGLLQGSGTADARYEAVLRSSTFPLREDLVCRLQLFYTYGAEESYELFFCPDDPAQAPFRSLKARWKRQGSVDPARLPCPPFPRTSWVDVLKKNEDKKYTAAEAATYALKLVAQEAERPRQILTLLAPVAPADWFGGRAIAFAQTKDGAGLCAVELLEKYFDSPKEIQREITEISCVLTPSTKLRVQSIQPDWWKKNDKGRMQIVSTEQDGEKCSIILFESSFVPGTFCEDADWLTFVWDSSRGRPDKKDPDSTCYYAEKILPDKIEGIQVFRAENVRAGRSRSFYAEQQLKGRMPSLYQVLTNGRTISDPECPEALRAAAQDAVPRLIKAFRQKSCAADPNLVRKTTFGALCLLAPGMGEICYPFLLEQARELKKARRTPSALGMALGSLTVPGQQELLKACLELPEDDVLCILARAVWNDENFVLQADPQLLLRWLCKAVSQMERIYLRPEQGSIARSELAMRCMEYILGVFRLRGVPGQQTELLAALSLKDASIRKLLECAKAACSRKEAPDLKKTQLHFQKSAAAEDQGIPDLLYTLLQCITGQDGDEIRITGIENVWDTD